MNFIYQKQLFILCRQAWDLALDVCLVQVPGILENNEPFQHSTFFAEQLTAFQVWLTFGSETRNPPEQLPIVLQVGNKFLNLYLLNVLSSCHMLQLTILYDLDAILICDCRFF